MNDAARAGLISRRQRNDVLIEGRSSVDRSGSKGL